MTAKRLPFQFWIVAAIAFVNSVGFTLIVPLIYPYAKEFGLSDFQASLLTTLYALCQFLATPVLGRLSDIWGRKPLLVLSLAGTVAANLMAGVTATAGLLFAARALDGVTGGNTSIARAVISDITPPERRAQAFGWFDAAFRSGFVIGPALGYGAQLLPTPPGVSSVGMGFLVSATIAAIAVVLTLAFLPETAAQTGPVRWSWGMFGFGRIARSLGRPRLGRVFALTFFTGFTFTIFTFAFQPFFLNVLGGTPKILAVLFVAIGVVGVVAQIFAVKPLVQRFNLGNILAWAIAVRGAIFLVIPLFPNFAVFTALLCLLGASNAFPMPLTSAIAANQSAPGEQGEVQGLNASYLSISNAIGPAVSGSLVGFGYGVPFWVAGGLTLLTAGLALRLRAFAGGGEGRGA